MVSKKETLATATGGFDREYKLIHVGAGYEIAGSMMRYVGECWRVEVDGPTARWSNAYLTLDEAQRHFDASTTPIEELNQ